METSNTNYIFNLAGRAYKAKLQPDEIKTLAGMRQDYQEARKNHDENYQENRPALIKKKEEEIKAKQPKPNIVNNFVGKGKWKLPPPRILTSYEIETEARIAVRRDYEKQRNKLDNDYKKESIDYLVLTLGLTLDEGFDYSKVPNLDIF